MPKKDFDAWCKGKEGTPHLSELTLETTLGKLGACHAVGNVWVCVHSESCTQCGRVLVRSWQMKKEDCPVYQQSTS